MFNKHTFCSVETSALVSLFSLQQVTVQSQSAERRGTFAAAEAVVAAAASLLVAVDGATVVPLSGARRVARVVAPVRLVGLLAVLLERRPPLLHSDGRQQQLRRQQSAEFPGHKLEAAAYANEYT